MAADGGGARGRKVETALTMDRIEAAKKAAMLIESCEGAIVCLENFLHDLHQWASDNYEMPQWQWEHHHRALFLAGIAGSNGLDWRQQEMRMEAS